MDLIRIPLEHRRWAMKRLLGAAEVLSPEQLDRPFEMGPGSVRAVLLHVIGSEVYWTNRLLEEEGRFDAKAHIRASMAEIGTLFEAVADEFDRVAMQMIESDRLAESIKAWAAPDAQLIRVGSVLFHVLNHGAHHRAQILNMLRHLGVRSLPAIDVDDWEQARK